MRRTLLMLIVLFTAWTVVPVIHAFAQDSGGDEQSDADKKKKKEEWDLKQAPLPTLKNSGPCPYVKVLYDADRYEEFKGGEEASSAVAYTGEIENLSADCAYKGVEPIHNKVAISFALGRGPQGLEARKTYRYWIAVTHRNKSVLAKEYFNLPVTFPAGQDRVGVVDTINDIVIPRADSKVSGENFEILVGFDVTPEMADFNRLGKRFRVNAGGPTVAEAQTGGR
jgi:hypothetical protein